MVHNRLFTDFELILFNYSILDILFDFMNNSEQCYICFSGSGGSTNKKILISMVSSIKYNRLYSVKCFYTRKHSLSNLENKIKQVV